MFVVQENSAWRGGITMALEHHGITYVTGTNGTARNLLQTTYTENRPTGYETNASYDFSSWRPVFRNLPYSEPWWTAITSGFGAEMVSSSDTGSQGDMTTFTYRVQLPFC
jgi:hypothetical protein